MNRPVVARQVQMSKQPYKSVPFIQPAGKARVNCSKIRQILPGSAAALASQTALSWQNRLKLILTRLVQSFRLMVGIHDYQVYWQHMQQHHPQQPVMTKKQFYRHCMEARYPSKAGKMGKCPC